MHRHFVEYPCHIHTYPRIKSVKSLELHVDGGDTGCIILEPFTKLACIVVSYHFIFKP